MTPEDSEQLLLSVLELKDQGKSTAEILAFFPEHQDEVKQTLAALEALQRQHKLQPRKDLLQTILWQLPPVTKNEATRSSLTERIFSPWKITFAASAFALVFLLFWGYTQPAPQGLALADINEEAEGIEQLLTQSDWYFEEQQTMEDLNDFDAVALEAEAAKEEQDIDSATELDAFFEEEMKVEEVGDALEDF
ncbi:MAG TPA: hypothetical protein VFE94_00390 [Candidatus Paceibacterota bacterium]|nr:hypothetical protein [Candidatus Paceibacterota bacterium]